MANKAIGGFTMCLQADV